MNRIEARCLRIVAIMQMILDLMLQEVSTAASHDLQAMTSWACPYQASSGIFRHQAHGHHHVHASYMRICAQTREALAHPMGVGFKDPLRA